MTTRRRNADRQTNAVKSTGEDGRTRGSGVGAGQPTPGRWIPSKRSKARRGDEHGQHVGTMLNWGASRRFGLGLDKMTMTPVVACAMHPGMAKTLVSLIGSGHWRDGELRKTSQTTSQHGQPCDGRSCLVLPGRTRNRRELIAGYSVSHTFLRISADIESWPQSQMRSAATIHLQKVYGSIPCQLVVCSVARQMCVVMVADGSALQ